MSFVKKNKGAIIFYLILVLSTLVIIQNNNKNLSTEEYLKLQGQIEVVDCLDCQNGIHQRRTRNTLFFVQQHSD